jgi:predicted dehydrogenase
MRLAIAGLGGWGRNWATLVQTTDEYQIVDIIDPSSSSREWALANLGLSADRIHSELADGLAASEAEGVLVLTPPDTHRAGAEAALAAGKHVLIEKPVSTNIADARAVIAAAEETGLTAMVSQNYRYSRPARRIRELILGGEIGDVLSVRNAYRRDFRLHLKPGDFRWQMPDPLLFDMSIHHFDLLRAMTGQEPVRVDARTWVVGDIDFVQPPSAVALMTLAGGGAYAYDGDWATHEEPLPWPGTWNIVGSRGQIQWDGEGRDGEPFSLVVRTWVGQTTTTDYRADGVDSRLGSLAEFRHAIETGTEPETSTRDNLNSLATVLTTVASSQRKETVEVAEILSS